MMAVCVMGVVCSLSMESDGSVLTVQIMTCAVSVTMETNISCAIDFTGLMVLIQTGKSVCI